jgi:hypothetical protein
MVDTKTMRGGGRGEGGRAFYPKKHLRFSCIYCKTFERAWYFCNKIFAVFMILLA